MSKTLKGKQIMKLLLQISVVYLSVLFIVQIYGCESKQPPKQGFTRGNLPERIEFKPFGKLSYITPKALVDSLNSGAKLHIYFLQDFITENPELQISLPGMISVFAGDVVNYARKQPPNTPVYLICPFGDDSKTIGKLVIKEGYDCYYLDGGSYRLLNEMRKNGWVIKPR